MAIVSVVEALERRHRSLHVCCFEHEQCKQQRAVRFTFTMQSEPEQMEVDAQNGASDGSTSDDSDYEEVEVSMEDMANITKQETELESNPNTYNVHLQVLENASAHSPGSGHMSTAPVMLLHLASGDRTFRSLVYAEHFLCSWYSTSPCCASAR